MTNIVGGNAGKIPHFDQGSDGIALSGTVKNNTGDFFDFISVLNDSLTGGEKNLHDFEKSTKLNQLNNAESDNELQILSDEELAKSHSKLSEIALNPKLNIIEEFQKSQASDIDKNISNSTFSQISGKLNTTAISSQFSNQPKIKTLLNSINLELEKLQIGRDFLALKNSESGYLGSYQAFLGQIEEYSSSKVDLGEAPEDLQEILKQGDVDYGSELQNLSGNALKSSQEIKRLPFENGENGYLLLDLTSLQASSSKNPEIILVNNLYLNREYMTDQNLKEQNYNLDALNLELKITAKDLLAELSNLNNGSSILAKEKHSLEESQDVFGITIKVPNQKLGVLNVSVSVENSQNFKVPETFALINFEGTQNPTSILEQRFQLSKIENASQILNNITASKIKTELGISQNELAIDQTHIEKSIVPIRNSNSIIENSGLVRSDLAVTSEISLIDKISLNEINSPNFAKFLKDRIQVAVNAVTRKINFKQEIAQFIEKSGATLIIQEAAKKVVKKEFGLDFKTNLKKQLFLSSADIISYRQAISNKDIKTDFLTKLNLNEVFKAHSENSELLFKSAEEQSSLLNNFGSTNTVKSNSEGVLQSTFETNIIKAQTTVDRSLNTQPQNFSQRISLLESQFSIRLSNALLEQAINSRENFDLVLEPETFGKVRVNVSIDSSQIDVKLTAENSSTLAILRSSEGMLQSISEQNGLKLAEYNVELNNNAQNNEGSNGRKDGKDQKNNLNETVEKLDEPLDPLDQKDDVHSLNLIA